MTSDGNGVGRDRGDDRAIPESAGELPVVDQLASRHVEQPATAELAHAAALVFMMAGLFNGVPRSVLAWWGGAVGVAIAARVAFRFVRRVRPVTTRTALRIGRVLLAATVAAWGVGGAVVIATSSPTEVAVVVVVFAGITTAGGAALVTDPISFYLLLGTLVGATVPALIANPNPNLAPLAGYLVLGAAAMTGFFRRMHKTLGDYIALAAAEAQRERRLAEKHALLDAVLASAPSAIVAVDGRGAILATNRGFERLFGYSVAEAIGQNLNSLIVPPREMDRALRWEAATRRDGLTVNESRRLRKDGTSVAVEISAARIEPVGPGALCVVYDDLTARREAEGARIRVEEQYRQLVESSSDLVWQVDLAGRWTFLSPACRSVYGVDPSELVGTTVEDRTVPARWEADKMAFDAVRQGTGLTNYATDHIDASGNVKHLVLTVRPARNGSGTVTGLIGLSRDESAVAETLTALDDARSVAEDAAEAKGNFLAQMSHEIRNPMNGVLGMVELLLASNLDAEQHRAVNLMQNSAGALVSLINDVLDFSKIEAGGLTLEETAFDLHALVDSVVRVESIRSFERGVDLAYRVHQDVPQQVVGDPGRYRQVLTNLISNAVKFTHEGEIAVSLSVEAFGDDAVHIMARVRDTGIGISASRLESIFEDYAQSDASMARQYGGSGLGLAIARRLSRLMKGDVTAESAEGVGSTFDFVVPLVPAEPAQQRPRVAPLAGQRMVVVGSQGLSRSIVADILRDAGVEGVECAGATEAADVAASHDVSVAIIDAHVACGDGFATAQQLREEAGRPDLQMVVLTAAGQRGDAQVCGNLGIAGYLTKPVSRSDLLEAVGAVVAGRGAAAGKRGLVTRHSIEETRRGVRVLLAEDNLVSRVAAEAMLRKRGHSVDVVDNGVDALAAVEDGDYDVVLMDVHLPGMDGRGVVDAIRHLPGKEDVPCIAVTADPRAVTDNARFDGCLLKPFRPHELFAAVEGWQIASDDRAGRWDPLAEFGSSPVNVGALRETLREAGVPEAADELLELFALDSPGRMEALEHAVATADSTRIEMLAHAFRSAAGTVQAIPLTRVLLELESAGRRGDIAGARQFLTAVRAEFSDVLTQLRDSEGIAASRVTTGA